jgi:hypothetical protein
MTPEIFVGPDGMKYPLNWQSNFGPVVVTQQTLIYETVTGETFVFDRGGGALPKSREEWEPASLALGRT